MKQEIEINLNMNNKILSEQIKRTIEYSSDNKQVNILDQRFYKRNNKYYPSV